MSFCNPHGSLQGTESVSDFKWTALSRSCIRGLWWVSQGKGGHGQSSPGCWPFMDSGISIIDLESLLTNTVNTQRATTWTRRAWRLVKAILLHTSCCDEFRHLEQELRQNCVMLNGGTGILGLRYLTAATSVKHSLVAQWWQIISVRSRANWYLFQVAC